VAATAAAGPDPGPGPAARGTRGTCGALGSATDSGTDADGGMDGITLSFTTELQ